MTTIAELREQVRGPIVEPGEDGYDEFRRVHNGMHDRRPAVEPVPRIMGRGRGARS